MNTKRRNKVLLIGLDLADSDLIAKWCKNGKLPHLDKLIKEGIYGNLKTTAEIMHLSAWPSLHTGTLPGKHGMYHAYQISVGEQETHRTRAEECKQPFFWQYADNVGIKSIILDAFLSYPIMNFNGIQIINWGTWTWFAEPQSAPKDLWKKIMKQVGTYPAPEHSKVLEVPEPDKFRKMLTSGANQKSDLVCWLMEKYPWDFFYVTFAEPHPAGHYLYHYMDRNFPLYTEHQGQKYGQALQDVYIAVDRAIGKILSMIDDNTTVIVVSVDGLGPNYAACHLIPDILTSCGYLNKASKTMPIDKKDSNNKKKKRNVIKAMRDLIPYSARRYISHYLPRRLQHQLSMKWASSNIDWGKTKAYYIPNANEGYIRINTKGREPHGLVSAGSEYDDFCDNLQGLFREMVNPLNGKPAVRDVVCTHKLYDGISIDSLPDIVVTWDLDAKIMNQLFANDCGTVAGALANYQTEPFYTGNHRPAAFYIARGPNVKKTDNFTGGHIVDIAPTILSLFDVEIPIQFDGSVLEESFDFR
jgi:predicted AlkP superfamily phosphohydrolase/phosphomutase